MCTEAEGQAEKIGSHMLKRDISNSIKVALWKINRTYFLKKNTELNFIAFN